MQMGRRSPSKERELEKTLRRACIQHRDEALARQAPEADKLRREEPLKTQTGGWAVFYHSPTGSDNTDHAAHN